MRVKVCLECRVLATTGLVAAEGAYRAVRALGRRQPPEAGWALTMSNGAPLIIRQPLRGDLGGAYRAVRAAS